MSSSSHTIQAKLLHADGITVYDRNMNPMKDEWINQTSVVVGITRKRGYSMSGPSVPLQLLGMDGNSSDSHSPGTSYYGTQWTNSAGKGNFLKWETKFDKKKDSEILHSKNFELSIGLVRGSEKIPLGVCSLSFAGPALMTQMDLPIKLVEPKVSDDNSDSGSIFKNMNSRSSPDSFFTLKKSSSSIGGSSISSSFDTVSSSTFGSVAMTTINGIQTVQFKSDSRNRRYGLNNAIIRINVMCLPTKQFVNLASFQSKVKKEIQKEPSLAHNSPDMRNIHNDERGKAVASISSVSNRPVRINASSRQRSKDYYSPIPQSPKHHKIPDGVVRMTTTTEKQDKRNPEILGINHKVHHMNNHAQSNDAQMNYLPSANNHFAKHSEKTPHTRHAIAGTRSETISYPYSRKDSKKKEVVSKSPPSVGLSRAETASSDGEIENDENQSSRANEMSEIKQAKPLQGILKTCSKSPRSSSRYRANPSPRRVEFVNLCAGKNTIQKETPSPEMIKRFSTLRF